MEPPVSPVSPSKQNHSNSQHNVFEGVEEDRQSDSQEGVPGSGINGNLAAAALQRSADAATDLLVELTETGEVIGDPTMHPEIKVMSFVDKAQKPPLNREDIVHRAGVLSFKASSTIFFASKWREAYVHVDPAQGILFSKDLDSHKKGRYDQILSYIDIRSVQLSRPSQKDAGSLAYSIFSLRLHPGTPGSRAFGTSLLLRAASDDEAELWVSELQSKLLITARVYTVGLNGEFPEHTRGVTPGTAICFSGGGGRAHVAAAGQLRALYHLGLLHKDKINYMSGVSAGAWATCIFTFYEEGARTDSELLGPLMSDRLGKLSMRGLEASLAPIFKPAEVDMWKVATELVWKTNPHELWETSMSRVFLKPFGLGHHVPFALREDVQRIKLENPQFERTRFNVTRSVTRPFWVAHGTIVGPQWARVHDMLPINFTPIYTGSPYLHKLHFLDAKHPSSHGKDLWVGGGMVDSFAFGGEEPEAFESGQSPGFVDKRSVLGGLGPMPAPLQEESRAFGAAVKELSLKAKGVRSSATSHTSNDEDLKAIEEAMISMRLGPHMIQRVFKYARDKLAAELGETGEAGPAGNDVLNEGCIERKVLLPHPEVHFSLRHSLAISSDAPSVNMHNRQLFKRLNVQQRYWTPVALDASNVQMTHAQTMDMGDGGSLDDTGLLGMLQRGVRKCIVFLNTVNKIPVPGTTFHRGSRVSISRVHLAKSNGGPQTPTGKQSGGETESPDRASESEPFPGDVPEVAAGDPLGPPQWDEWPDDDILPFFGQKVDEEQLNYLGTHHSQNHVFDGSQLRPLLSGFQALFKEGKPLVYEQKLAVLENPYWGIDGGWEVSVLWVYLEDARQFIEALPKDTQAEIKRADKGEFARFPNFWTFGGQAKPEIALSRRQINLLSTFAEWTIMINKDKFVEFLSNVPPVVRKRKTRQTCLNMLECQGLM